MWRSACGSLLRPQIWNFTAGQRWMSILPSTERKLIKLSGEDFHSKEVHKWKPLFCRFGVAAKDHGFIKKSCIQAIQRVLKRRLKPDRLIIRITPKQPVTKKPIGKKLGGGKGKVVDHQCWVRRGKIILEFDTTRENEAIKAARGVGQRLPMKTAYIRKPKTAEELKWEKLLSGER